jgi:hypothetical protein
VGCGGGQGADGDRGARRWGGVHACARAGRTEHQDSESLLAGALACFRSLPYLGKSQCFHPFLPSNRYPDNAWELLLGYEQEAFLGARAGAAVAGAIRAAEAAAAGSSRDEL